MLKYKLSGVLLSVISANILSIVITVFAVRIFKYLQPGAVNKTEMAGMAKYTTPLIFNAINWWLMGGFDRYIIVSFLGLQYNGIYEVANKYAAILFYSIPFLSLPGRILF